MDIIEDVLYSPLKQITTSNGSVWRGLRSHEPSFNGFGEAYFSFVNQDTEKPWRQHKKMFSNLIVNCGKIEFILEDGRKSSNTYGLINKFILSEDNYARLTIPPGVWFKFKGLAKKNSLLNIASITHDPDESLTR